MPLAISIPEKKVSAWMAETTVSETSNWLSRLPAADSLESARNLHQALYTLNRMELAPKNRLELMELYRVPVSQVTGQLQNRLSSSPYPLSMQRFRLAEFIRDLHIEMAYGYKVALLDMETVKRPLWGKSSTRANAIFRSVHYLGNTVLRSISCYLAYPKDIWREIHSLYQFAESTKCLHEPVAEYDVEASRTSTIAKRYKEILLLGLAEPYQMQLGQSKLVNAFVYRWADLVEIEPIARLSRNGLAQFVIDFDRDEPGESAIRKRPRDEDLKSSSRLLSAAALTEHIESFIRRLDTGTPAKELDLGGECLEEVCRDMLEKMLQSWKGSQARRSTRISMQGKVSVCAGLAPIHHYVQLQRATTVSQMHSDTKSTPMLLGQQSVRGNEVTGKPRGLKVAQWEILNASSGGALVRGQENSGVNVHVGELVALVDSDSRTPVKLFVIRWMRDLGAKGLEVGLELMSSTVGTILVGQEQGEGSYVPALVLEKVSTDTRKLPKTLVLDKGLRGKQKDIEVLEPGDTDSKWVRVLESIDQTNTYERVSYASLSRRDR